MKVSSGDDCIFKDERVVRGAVHLNLKDPASMCNRVPDSTVYLGDTAHAVCVLNTAAFAVSSRNQTPLQKTGEVACAKYLSRVWPSCMPFSHESLMWVRVAT